MSPNALASYLKKTAKLKGSSLAETKKLEKTIQKAFGRVYRAVALDVDGTITEPATSKLSGEMVVIISRLLEKGIPVILISGRGRTSLRAAATQVRRESKISDWYLRRLQCVCYNGLIRLYTKTSKPDKFLELEDFLFETSKEQRAILEAYKSENEKYVVKFSSKIGYLRIRADVDGFVERVPRNLSGLAEKLGNLPGSESWFISRSLYEGQFWWTLTPKDKSHALERIAKRLGLPSSTILRIGDSGGENGNDESILNCDSGFSVGSVSEIHNGCLPIFSKSGEQLRGADGTQRIISTVKIFPPLSLQAENPESIEKRIADLTGFEKLVTARSRIEAKTIDAEIDGKHRSLLPTGARLRADELLCANDLFDIHSGAVRMRFWELEELAENSPASISAFGLPQNLAELDKFNSTESFALFSDTSLLLRGPVYYWSLTAELLKKTRRKGRPLRTSKSLRSFCDLHRTHMVAILAVLRESWYSGYGLCQLKVLLSILDQIRNLAITILYSDFSFREKGGMVVYNHSQLGRVIFMYLCDCADVISKILFNMDFTWGMAVRRVSGLIEKVVVTLQSSLLESFFGHADSKSNEVFKFRECDHFIQNFSALSIAFRDFARHEVIGADSKLVTYGLVYGGFELPAIAQVVGARLGISVVPKVARVSLYGNKNLQRRKIYQADQEYVEKLKNGVFEVTYTSNGRSKIIDCIILDDNCTTCSTLQLARDALVSKGLFVRGCIAVRYPSTNRLLHMGMASHGFPDPENLLSFVRGLVAPSPYSRLLRPGRGKHLAYVDETKVFDKSKNRIARYITKHLNLNHEKE